jgi:hypothetical protein
MDATTKADEVVTYQIEAFTLLGIAILVTSLRTYSRLKLVGIRRFEADDYLVLVGAVSVLDGPLTHLVWTMAHYMSNVCPSLGLPFPRNRLCIWQRRHCPWVRKQLDDR